jgi:hypothetical protein
MGLIGKSGSIHHKHHIDNPRHNHESATMKINTCKPRQGIGRGDSQMIDGARYRAPEFSYTGS